MGLGTEEEDGATSRNKTEEELMRIMVKWGMAVVAVGLLATVGVAQEKAQEKKIKRSDLPAPVEKTVGEVSQGATIKEFSKETENDIRSRDGSQWPRQGCGN